MDEITKVTLYNGRELSTHFPQQCAGEFCCIHNPSDHPLKDAPKDWLVFPSEGAGVIYRMCEHGKGHPDPDSTEFLSAQLQIQLVEAIYSTHMASCDRCCHRPSD